MTTNLDRVTNFECRSLFAAHTGQQSGLRTCEMSKRARLSAGWRLRGFHSATGGAEPHGWALYQRSLIVTTAGTGRTPAGPADFRHVGEPETAGLHLQHRDVGGPALLRITGNIGNARRMSRD